MSVSGEKIVGWSHEVWQRPDSTKFPTFYPDTQPPVGLVDSLQQKWGDTVVFAFGYGSFYNGEGGPDSLADVIVVSKNPRAFHQRGLEVSPQDYGTSRNLNFHLGLNHAGINFYRTEFQVDGQPQKAKYGVIDLENFVKYAQGSRRDSLRAGKGRGFYTVAGRIQKAMLVPLITSQGSEQEQVDIAINQSRIDGVISAIAFMPSRFHYQDLANIYADLSYMADRRVEKDGKAKSLVGRNPLEYALMFQEVLGQFIEAGILEEVGEGEFDKRYTLAQADVENYLKASANYATLTNYAKNPLTVGARSGMNYILDKLDRAEKANGRHSMWSTVLGPFRAPNR